MCLVIEIVTNPGLKNSGASLRVYYCYKFILVKGGAFQSAENAVSLILQEIMVYKIIDGVVLII